VVVFTLPDREMDTGGKGVTCAGRPDRSGVPPVNSWSIVSTVLRCNSFPVRRYAGPCAQSARSSMLRESQCDAGRKPRPRQKVAARVAVT
jgi:hypothetical protein